MSQLQLYPTVKVVGQSFSGEKLVTVPDQSLSIRQILVRYVRRQVLPVSREDGIYVEGLGDLEKISREDMVDRDARIASVRAKVAAVRPKKVESPAPGPTPSGVVTGSPGQGQAPPSDSPPKVG